MELNVFIAQVAIIFLPGIIWARLDVQYGSKVKPNDIEFLLRALMFGLASYLAVFVAYGLFRTPFDLVDFSKAEDQNVLSAQLADEVLWGVAASIVMAIGWLYLVNYKVLTRVFQWLKITKAYGDEDVWDFTLNSGERRVTYLHLRDFSKELVYAGYVNTFSETGRMRELVLSDVKLYDFNGELLFETPLLYLARSPDDLHIEFPSP